MTAVVKAYSHNKKKVDFLDGFLLLEHNCMSKQSVLINIRREYRILSYFYSTPHCVVAQCINNAISYLLCTLNDRRQYSKHYTFFKEVSLTSLT